MGIHDRQDHDDETRGKSLLEDTSPIPDDRPRLVSYDFEDTHSLGGRVISRIRAEKTVGFASGWYVLEGASRIYNATVPPEHCAGISTLDILVDTDRDDLSGSLKVDESKCRK